MAQNFYCEYCGAKYSSIASLTSGYCLKHPNGPNKGKHKLYEGGDGYCLKHPNGPNKGKHAPAL